MDKFKLQFIFLILISLIVPFNVCLAGEDLDLKDEKARLSYSVGYQVGSDFVRQGKDVNPDVLLKGVLDAMSGNEPPMSPQEMRTVLTELQRDIVAVQEKKMREEAEKNLEAGRAFLAENGKKEGVRTMPSGLQYKVINKGSGKTPTENDMVTVHYRGTLTDGTEFDSSYKRKQSVSFRVDSVIKGWTEALLMMKEGDKWELFIPPDLAYGDKRTGKISPNSTLIFEVTLISVQHSH
jgi:FKBP-type peptidyl-prolyl cis-trans isomerase FklB